MSEAPTSLNLAFMCTSTLSFAPLTSEKSTLAALPKVKSLFNKILEPVRALTSPNEITKLSVNPLLIS